MPRYVTLIEVQKAVKQTRQDLLELYSEIGREDYLRIFNEYNPAGDDCPPGYLSEQLFGIQYGNKHEQYLLSEEYLLKVWKRTNEIGKTLKTNIEKTNTLQTKWLRFRKTIFERDDYKCQECGTNKHLQAHHIKPRKDNPELCYEPSNVVTLCRECHAKRHPEKSRKLFVREVKPCQQ